MRHEFAEKRNTSIMLVIVRFNTYPAIGYRDSYIRFSNAIQNIHFYFFSD